MCGMPANSCHNPEDMHCASRATGQQTGRLPIVVLTDSHTTKLGTVRNTYCLTVSCNVTCALISMSLQYSIGLLQRQNMPSGLCSTTYSTCTTTHAWDTKTDYDSWLVHVIVHAGAKLKSAGKSREQLQPKHCKYRFPASYPLSWAS